MFYNIVHLGLVLIEVSLLVSESNRALAALSALADQQALQALQALAGQQALRFVDMLA